ncbi:MULTISPECIES: dipeptidase [Prevotella]|nr:MULTISPECIES: C69 family dipeptidase [Prevotella]MCI6048823.1 C69 family dipeptidase [Prevotella pectinovora]MDD7743408.1 C69 family dipeptidase [Prevotella pectinovora]MDY4779664.1 C69 family dipeptidase [Prevotella pectinovora]MEE1547246.1 C69 family dipeptidase [Prevotella pectinovora]CDD05427.1 peptidase family C69 [Prevotella sp. CAG:592]
MRKLFLSLLLCTGVINALACTNFIVGKKASADGSVMCTYSADDYGMFLGLCHYPAGKHAKGEMLQIYDWDTKEYHGQIPQAAETYNVIGNINEYQVTIGETTFGGREEMVDTTGILDYGSLIYIALQRSKTAREAISVMTRLVETYGFCSEGETFTICDPNEAWIMEMMGKGPGSKGVVWVAVRIPDDAICAHANQSRIRTFDQKDKKNVMFSKDCIKFARSKGWFTGKDKDFSFCDVYAAPTFSGRRACEARVWSFFNRFGDMDKYLPYVEGKVKDAEPMPLWIVPNKKVSLQDLEASMRDHYEGTPFDLGNDLGQGVWEMPYRPTPLSFKVDGKAYFNERPVSTQQTAFSYVSQMRSWLPRQIGGVLWFGNDDGNMVAYTPIYCGNTVQPECYNTPGADAVTFSDKNAFWVCNWVSNMVYPRYSQMFPSLKEVRDSLDNSYIANQGEIEKQALKLYGESEQKAVDYLTDYSNTQAQQMLARWKELAIYLIVKYNDMAVKPTKDGKFLRTKTGNGATVKRTGFPEKVARALVKQTGDRFASPE